MKEATGDLSMTAVAIVAIAAIAAVFTMLIWPNIRATINRNTLCSQAINCTGCEGDVRQCMYIPADGGVPMPVPGGCPCDNEATP